ncbi:class I SAM-dependent methyltransferase [Candidatus Pelagibacter sp.]|nr:class I SAM-dependent methyltransferase [Candidatus Pelagibacter sp.]
MTRIKTKIGKTCDITQLKGVTYKDFRGHNIISEVIGKEFLRAKKKIIKKCIICGSKNVKLIAKVMRVPFMQCRKCTHVFNRYDYDYDFLKKFWKKKGDVINVHSHKGQQSYRPKHLSDPKVDFILKNIKKRKGLNWLDMACGNGEFLTRVKRKGIKPYGFDLNENDVKLARIKKLNVYRKDMTEFTEFALSKNIKFDIASATGYFDLVNDPNYELKTFNKIMKKGGLLMIDLPDFNSVCHEMIRYFPDQSIRHLHGSQRSSYTLKSLTLLLKNNGYKIINRWIYGIDFYMIMNVLNIINKEFYKTNAMKIMTKHFSKFQDIFDKEKSADTLFIVAKKI